MLLAADVLDRIVAGRVIASAQLMAGWDFFPGDRSFQRRIGDELVNSLRREYSDVEGDLFGPTGILMFTASERHARLTSTGILLRHEFAGAYTQQWELAARFIEQTWQPILGLLVGQGVSITELGLVVTFQMSTEGFEGVDPNRVVTRFVAPSLQQELVDAEVRLVVARDERYLLNLAVGSYRKVVLTSTFRTGEPKSRGFSVSDRGIQVKVDINTNYPLLFQGRVVPVAPEELKKLVELTGDVLAKKLRSIMEAARE